MDTDDTELASRFFGMHPAYRKILKRRERNSCKSKSFRDVWAYYNGKPAKLSQFSNHAHPAVTLIPRNTYIEVFADEHYLDPIGPSRMQGYFSSYDFCINTHKGVFTELDQPALIRQGGIHQLGCLVQPFQLSRNSEYEFSYVLPIYPHVRIWHLRISAAMDEVILATNGFTQEERAGHVLTVLTHDIALPAGGDSTKRIDPNVFDEERNYAEFIRSHKLDHVWKKRYGFDLGLAHSWVRNEGMLGLLLDVVDKLSYVLLDCYYFGRTFDGQVRRHCIQHPLFMDVWRDIKFVPDKSAFAFTNPDRLYQFLLARALEHQELLLNPQSRVVDFAMTHRVAQLYQSGKITRDNLLTWTNWELQQFLDRHYTPEGISLGMVTTDDYDWRKCTTETELQQFVSTLPQDTLISTEHIKGFDTCLDWPVFDDRLRNIVPLRKRLSVAAIRHMESIRDSCIGHFAYWYTKRPR